MFSDVLPTIALAGLFAAAAAYIFLHWRLHPKQSSLDTFAALQTRLNGSRPVLILFSAPL